MAQTPAKTHRDAHRDGSRSSGGGERAAKPTRGLGLSTAHARQTEKNSKIEKNEQEHYRANVK